MSLDLVYPVILFVLLFVILFVLKVFLRKPKNMNLVGKVAESLSEFEVDEMGEVRIINSEIGTCYKVYNGGDRKIRIGELVEITSFYKKKQLVVVGVENASWYLSFD